MPPFPGAVFVLFRLIILTPDSHLSAIVARLICVCVVHQYLNIVRPALAVAPVAQQITEIGDNLAAVVFPNHCIALQKHPGYF